MSYEFMKIDRKIKIYEITCPSNRKLSLEM